MVHNDNNASYVRGTLKHVFMDFLLMNVRHRELIFNELFFLLYLNRHTYKHKRILRTHENGHNNTDNIVEMH